MPVEKTAVGVVIALLCYLGFATAQLTLPGLEYDEVFFGPAALGQTQDYATVTSGSVARFSPLRTSAFVLSLGKITLPVMLLPYWGALKVYLSAAVFSVWGTGPWTVRAPVVVLGMLTLWLFYQLQARLFSPDTALLALALLASDPSFVFYTRHDFAGTALSVFLMAAPLWCLMRWRECGALKWWAATFFLFGLGLYHRLEYLAFLAAVGLTVLWHFWPSAVYRLPSTVPRGFVDKKAIVVAWVCWLVGASPLLCFVWQRPAMAASLVSLAMPDQEIVPVVRLKAYVLWTVLNGISLYDSFTARSGIAIGKVTTAAGETQVGSFVASEQTLGISSLYSGTLIPYCLLFVAIALWLFHPPPALKAMGVLLVALLLCLLGLQGALRGHHFVAVLPVTSSVLAGTFAWGWQQLRHRQTKRVLVVLGVALVVANVTMNLRYHYFLAAVGGRGVWSDAIYDLSRYLQERCQQRPCLVGDWGMGTQIVTLTGGQLAVEEVFWSVLLGEGEEAGERWIRTENALFVFYTDPYVNFSRPKHVFFRAAQQAGVKVVVEQTFRDREGNPVIEVVRVAGRT